MTTNNITLVTHADYLSFTYKDWHKVLLHDYNAERVTAKCDCGKCDHLVDAYYFKMDSNDPELKQILELVKVDVDLRAEVVTDKRGTQMTWYVVSISKADGHDINGKFITDNYDTVRALARAVYPLEVTQTALFSEDEGIDLLDALDDAYVQIDPQDYIDQNACATEGGLH